jgi:hypothetical protein
MVGRHFGAMRSIELWCAIAHLRISRFRVWSFGPSRNDDLNGSTIPASNERAQGGQKARSAVPTIDPQTPLEMVGTLRFAHPTHLPSLVGQISSILGGLRGVPEANGMKSRCAQNRFSQALSS